MMKGILLVLSSAIFITACKSPTVEKETPEGNIRLGETVLLVTDADKNPQWNQLDYAWQNTKADKVQRDFLVNHQSVNMKILNHRFVVQGCETTGQTSFKMYLLTALDPIEVDNTKPFLATVGDRVRVVVNNAGLCSSVLVAFAVSVN